MSGCPKILGQQEVTPEQAAINKARAKEARKAGQKVSVGPCTPQPAITPIIPVSRAGWYAGIAKGIYPAPVKLSERVAAWPVESIRALMTVPAAA